MAPSESGEESGSEVEVAAEVPVAAVPPPRARRPRSRSPFQPRRKPLRSRSRSPPRRRRRASPPPPLYFSHGRLVVVDLLDDAERREASWKDVFRQRDYLLYDNKYPFRMAAEMVLRQNKQYRQRSRFQTTPTRQYADFLYQQSSEFLGVNFETDYFVDWVDHLSVHERQQSIVVFGLGHHPGARHMLRCLRKMGAVVVSPPEGQGDHRFSAVRDLEKFLKDL